MSKKVTTGPVYPPGGQPESEEGEGVEGEKPVVEGENEAETTTTTTALPETGESTEEVRRRRRRRMSTSKY